MAGWYNKVKDNLANIVPAIDHFERELEAARKETFLNGNLESNSKRIPGEVAYRFAQLQEVEAILNHLNIELRKIHRAKYRKYLEHYNRALSSRDAEKFAEGDQDYIDMEHVVNEFALVRNKYLAVMKGLDAKQFQINNITRLRVAGMEDISLD